MVVYIYEYLGQRKVQAATVYSKIITYLVVKASSLLLALVCVYSLINLSFVGRG